MVPEPIYDNETVPTPFVTMVELVFGATHPISECQHGWCTHCDDEESGR